MSAPSAAVVLISVRPPYVDQLLNGTKTVELRRRTWRVEPGTRALVYASGTTRAIVGSFVVAETHVGPPAMIWKRYHRDVGLSRDDFDSYLAGANQAVAILASEVRRLSRALTLDELRSRFPSFVPPQSYRRVDPVELGAILNGERKRLLARVPAEPR